MRNAESEPRRLRPGTAACRQVRSRSASRAASPMDARHRPVRGAGGWAEAIGVGVRHPCRGHRTRRWGGGYGIIPAAALALMSALFAMPGVANAQSAGTGTEPRAADRDGASHGKLLGAEPTQYPEWFKHSFLDLEEDVGEAREAGRRALLFFHQDGCPYCNALIEEVFALDDVEQKVRAHFDVVEMNMWGDREVLSLDGTTFTEKTFAAAMRVQFTPTLVFLGERGEPVLRLNGYLPPAEFRAALDFVGDGHYRDTTFREFARAARTSTAEGAMTPQPFFMRPPHVLTRGPGSKPLAVFFERPDCARCEALHRGPVSEEETRALLAGFDVVQLDAWSDTPVMTPRGLRVTAREWAGQLGIAYEPTIVYFDSGGEEVIRSEAFFKTFHTQSMMDYVLSGAWRDEPSFQRYISARADRFLEQGTDVDIWR